MRPSPCLPSSHSFTPAITKDKDPIFKSATPTYAEAHILKKRWKLSQPAVVLSLSYSIWTISWVFHAIRVNWQQETYNPPYMCFGLGRSGTDFVLSSIVVFQEKLHFSLN